MLHKTWLFAYIPGEFNAYDIISKESGRSYYEGKTFDEMKSEHPEMLLLEYEQFEQMTTKAATTSPKQITEQEFFDALDCLPPMNWIRRGETESFMFSEMFNGQCTSVFVRQRDKFFMWRDNVKLTHDQLVQKLPA